MAGKGDKRRPMQIPQKEYDKKWKRIFMPMPNQCIICDKPATNKDHPTICNSCVCSWCYGTGGDDKEKCTECNGTGIENDKTEKSKNRK